MTERNCSGDSRVAGTAVPTPALLTRTSTRPNASIVASTSPWQSSGFATSVPTAIARRPAASTRPLVSSRRSTRRAPSATSAPASASAFANATPRPEEAPVTIAALPSRRKRSRTVMHAVYPEAGNAYPVPTPAWVPRDLYPFEHHHADIRGCRVHYVDEGEGPPLLLLHGNPTWSFLYRDVIRGLSDRFRCVAPDLPGFGLSRAAPGYGFTAAEHAAVIERLVLELDLAGVTMMVQDW